MKKVVITTMTANLIHPGHIKFLKDAKSLGDSLIVFLDSDKRNRDLKGHKAIFSYRERFEILNSIKYVDLVYEYHGPNESFKKFIDGMRVFDKIIFVKASDYSFSELDKKQVDIIKQAGGVIALLEYDQRYSTTEIFRKIKNS